MIHDGTPEGMPPFAQIGDANIRVFVHFLRILQGGPAPKVPEVPTATPGEVAAGRALFFGKGQCATCHMIEGKGGFLGSDLTNYGQSHDAAAILRAITKPDERLDPSARVVTATTDKGQTLTGVVKNEDNFSMDLETQDGRYHSLQRNALVKVNDSDHSLMPRDYGERLSTVELNDIAGFLQAATNGAHTTVDRDR
jgi:cytochrome c oxidase cbb3-type subunit III